MSGFQLIISSPDGDVFRGEATQLILRGAEGDLAIMAGHISLITSVKPGECRVVFSDGTTKAGRTNGGLLTVSKENVTLLSGSFRWTEEN